MFRRSHAYTHGGAPRLPSHKTFAKCHPQRTSQIPRAFLPDLGAHQLFASPVHHLPTMYAFLPATALPLSAKPVLSVTQRRPATRRLAQQKCAKMWTMDDLPEELRIPEGPRIGFSDYSEKLNGRLAMVAFVVAVIVELLTGEGLVPKILTLLGQ